MLRVHGTGRARPRCTSLSAPHSPPFLRSSGSLDLKRQGTGRTLLSEFKQQLSELTERERGVVDFLNTRRRLSLSTKSSTAAAANLSRFLVPFKSRTNSLIPCSLIRPESRVPCTSVFRSLPGARSPTLPIEISLAPQSPRCSCAVSAASERHIPPHTCQNRCTTSPKAASGSGLQLFDLELERARSQSHTQVTQTL
jgi:hypothetical protein